MSLPRSAEPKHLRGQRNQCPTCLEYFNTVTGFDDHRTGSFAKHQRRCLTVDEMRAKGMTLGDDGFWLSAISEADKMRLKMRRQAISGNPANAKREEKPAGNTPT